MIRLKLKSGAIATLTPKRDGDNTLQLLDDSGVSQLEIKEEGNQFVWKDKKDIDVEDAMLRQELDGLYVKLKEEETIGVEEGDDNTEVDPFNPDEISLSTKIFSMDTCLRRLIQGTITLNPDFHRSEVWTVGRKSQLIESLILKIPIPMFYVSADESSHLTVIDGLQRLSAIRDYILGKDYLETKNEELLGDGFRLRDLEFWKDLEGKTFRELPTNIARRILETEFTFTIVNPGTPEEVRRNIFRRINTGDMQLSNQEIRNVLYAGKITNLLHELADSDVFKNATDHSIKSMRMEDRELILRLVSFLVRRYTSFTKAVSADTWLSDTMIIVNAMPELNSRELKRQVSKTNATIEMSSIVPISLDAIKEQFNIAMDRSHKLFKNHAFRKSYSGKRRTAVNKSLFETWGILLSELTIQEFDRLCINKSDLMNEYKKLIDSNDFAILISRDSMKPSSIKDRFKKINDLIKTHMQ